MKQMTQRYTSADTSVNTVKVPALFTNKRFLSACDLVVDTLGLLSILDFGCGRGSASDPQRTTAELSLKAIYGDSVSYDGYDLTWKPDRSVFYRKHTFATCSNVLNVIAEQSVREDIYRILSLNASMTFYYIYNSHKQGESKPGCYQMGKPASFYADEMSRYYQSVVVKGNMIIASIPQ